jgi:hypothetical protein
MEPPDALLILIERWSGILVFIMPTFKRPTARRALMPQPA